MVLHQRTAIVTGAGRGVGAAIAAAMAREGARVVLADQDEPSAQRTAQALREAGGQAEAIRADVGDASDAAAIIEFALERFERLDILVNNAGIGLVKPFMQTTPADLDRIMRVNLTGAMLCAQAAVRAMLPRGYGRIVNVTSISGLIGSQGRTAYGASKAALCLMTKVMALELGSAGIVVNAIAPGPIETEMASAMHSVQTRERYHSRMPVGRYGLPAEIAAAAVYLASEAAGFVSGHTLTVDGGFTAAGLPVE